MQLEQYGFPGDARVFVEAYRQTRLMRFDFGTVSVPRVPADRKLLVFEDETEVLFRVRVTATSGRPGLLLGEADQLRPRNPTEGPDRRVPLLPPVPGDIGEEVWRVEFEGAPLLRISSLLPDWKQTVRSEAFRAFVYPAALRAILQRILYIEGYSETDDFSDWRSRWLLFATRIPGAGPIPSKDGYDEWIDNAVAAFSRLFAMRSRYTAELKGAA